jgi:hypothetical protein
MKIQKREYYEAIYTGTLYREPKPRKEIGYKLPSKK